MDGELHKIAQHLEQACTPEEVFGDLGASGTPVAADLKKAYHRLARITHPDAYSARDDQLLAQAAFTRLGEWLARAQAKLDANVYGKSAGSGLDGWRLVLETKRGVYVVDNDASDGPLYTSFPATCTQDGRSQPVTLKITNDPRNNDLAANEALALRSLSNGKASDKFSAYIPRLLDTFLYTEDGLARQVNVFKRSPDWYTLEQVRQAYPGGIDPRDMAWMWRRILVVLGFAHLNGILHGAVLPANIKILPEAHGLKLVEWSYASIDAGDSASLAALDPRYEAWYPGEVQRREALVPGTDIDMAARCMIYLLGGNPTIAGSQAANSLPGSVPPPIRAFIKGCILESKRSRPQDAWALKEEFDALLQCLWGERKFHPFFMK